MLHRCCIINHNKFLLLRFIREYNGIICKSENVTIVNNGGDDNEIEHNYANVDYTCGLEISVTFAKKL